MKITLFSNFITLNSEGMSVSLHRQKEITIRKAGQSQSTAVSFTMEDLLQALKSLHEGRKQPKSNEDRTVLTDIRGLLARIERKIS